MYNSYRIHHIETHGSVLLALQHDRMEVAKTKQNRFHLAVAFFKGFLVQGSECSLDVGLQARGGLVRDLDATIQQADGDRVRGIRR